MLWQTELEILIMSLFTFSEIFTTINGVQWFRNLSPPISEDILIFFVAHCFDTLKLQHSTIKLYLCGIRYQYMKWNSTNPCETSDKNYLSLADFLLFLSQLNDCKDYILEPDCQ
jgi:hypothetical protein